MAFKKRPRLEVFTLTRPSHGTFRKRQPRRFPRMVGAWIGSAVVSLCLWNDSLAQTAIAPSSLPPAQSAEEGLRRQEDRARELQLRGQPKSDVLNREQGVTVPDELPTESPCFVISEIRLNGPDAGLFRWLSATTAPYLDRCIGVIGLRQIAATLDAKLIEWGYVTSKVSLPQQNLKDGVLTFRLHAGRVAQVNLYKAGAASTEDDAWGTWRTAFPVGSGDILNVRDLEQGVEQMKRLPSQAVATELEPGAEPDTSNVRILRQSGTLTDRLRGGATLDDSGSKTLGRAQFSGYLSLDNPFGLNDILSVSANTNVESVDRSHRTQSASLNYSLPWGYNTFTFSKSNSRFAQVVQGTTVRFLSSGRSESAELRWHRTMLRTSAAKTGLFAALSTRRASSFLDDVELVVQRRRTTGFTTGVTYKQLLGNAAIDLEASYRRGMPWRGAQDDLPTAADGGLTLRPKIWQVTAAYQQPFNAGGMPVQFSASLRAQHTRDQTLSVDQISIGDRFTVRGFDGDSVLLAENGYVLRNDLSTPVRLIEGVDSVAFVAIDFGRVWGPSDINLVGDKLAGLAGGLRGRWKRLQFDLTLATPLYKPEGFHSARWNTYLSATYAF
ncbi:ShlB/FhaC/HecB family hemolysin secretion/activation protein [Noviherbaspirillum agri]